MAVELCKVNLWMEALEPGKPLNFLDHRIQVGNSLLGTTPKLMTGGIPDDAFSPIEGDDPKYAATLKKQNKQERKDRETGQRSMFELIEPPANYASLTQSVQALDQMPDGSLSAIRQKEAYYRAIADDPNYKKARLLADAWCAAFVWRKSPRHSELPFELSAYLGLPKLPLTDLIYRRLEDNPDVEDLSGIRSYTAALADKYQFFHWHVAFPDVFTVPEDLQHAENEQTGWHGGFDVVLGNPPWDQIQLDDREFFAVSAPEIAGAANMSARKKMIAKLAKDDPDIHSAYLQAVRANDGVKHFAHASGCYPFTSFGRLNTAPLFCELGLNIINPQGYSALIVPTGIATDSFNQYFFNHIVDSHALSSLFDFENARGIFPAVHRSYKFCLLVLNGLTRTAQEMRFAFFAHAVSDLPEITFSLTPEDIALLNPNTRTTPIFRTKRDADLTKSIYQRVPILIREGEPEENPWGIKFQLMFMMNTDSHLFRTRDELEGAGFTLVGNHFVRGDARYLPLYEAKMMHQFTHRWATYTPDGSTRDMTPDEQRDPSALVIPRYWVDAREVAARLEFWNQDWLLGFRDIARPTDERTAIFDVIPLVGVGNKIPLWLSELDNISNLLCLFANTTAFALDFVVRQKIGGASLNFFYVKQFPVIPPHTYTPALLDFIVPRVLELTYTAWDLQPFAQDVGYHGAPFVWDEERRFLMRCELDALYFHLYQISRDDVDYIMETFPIVKRKDIKATSDENGEGGEYLTKRVILEMYDQMAGLALTPVPSPKGRGENEGTYLVPDVSQWATWLSPGPADPRVAHPEREG
ncbi:MAG: class I SAM-dependent DNA methyltransferase, partial [Anaerolinea sp.]|nr:class I SAM-dependent DNA methyltransferase [Anaerolinea sp.]